MNYFAVPSLISFVVLLLLGAFTLGRNPSRSLNRVFFAVMALMGFWALCEFGMRLSGSYEAALIWLRAECVTPFAAAALVHFSLLLCSRPAPMRPIAAAAIYLPPAVFCCAELAAGALFGDPVHRPWGWTRGLSAVPWAYWPYVLWASGCAVVSLALCIAEFVRTDDPDRKSSLGAFIFSVSVLTLVGLVPDTLFRFMGISSPELMLSAAGLVGIVLALRISQGELFGVALAAASEDIVDIMADCMILVGPHERIVRVNQAALRLLGYRECELIDKGVGDIFERGTYDSTLFRETRLEELERSGFFADIGAVFVTKTGVRVPVSVSESLLRNRKGRPLGVVLFARDLSERRKLEAEVLRAQKLDSLSKLARGVAHDFNNILTAVLGNISLARSRVERSSDLHAMLRSAEKAALIAKGLSRQLLTFTKGGDPIKQAASVGKLVRDTVEFTLRGADVRCDCRIPADLLWAEVDREQIEQVIANIVINAKQAMHKGGTLSVRCRNTTLAADQIPYVPGGPAIEIAVQDTGTGISQENLEKVFDPFFTTKSSGSGLGLAVSQSIVRKHNGSIVCESIEGVGSTFKIYLPACDQTGPQEDTGAYKIDKSSARILVMDDDELVRLTFESVLVELGYTVEMAVEGGEALDKYAQAREAGRPYDVVIMDLVIPGGLGGKETIARLRNAYPDAVAVVTSGYSDDPVMANYREYGFSGVLPKPFKIDEVATAVEQALALRKQRK